MASTFTLAKQGKTEIEGTKKLVVWKLDCTSYDKTNGGIKPTAAQLGLKAIERIEIMPLENNRVARWDGSKTAPALIVYMGKTTDADGAAGVEPADATDVGEFLIKAYGK
jgi:hypothetical protein